jgi:hypothetical protein
LGDTTLDVGADREIALGGGGIIEVKEASCMPVEAA